MISGNWNDNEIKELLASHAKEEISLQISDDGSAVYYKMLH